MPNRIDVFEAAPPHPALFGGQHDADRHTPEPAVAADSNTREPTSSPSVGAAVPGIPASALEPQGSRSAANLKKVGAAILHGLI